MRKVATWGTFDLLHEGHHNLLRRAKDLGDFLAVIIIPDQEVHENKGRYPINNQEERAQNVRDFPFVDEVYIDSLTSGLESVIALKPDICIRL